MNDDALSEFLVCIAILPCTAAGLSYASWFPSANENGVDQLVEEFLMQIDLLQNEKLAGRST
jgi:hypothetical protein